MLRLSDIFADVWNISIPDEQGIVCVEADVEVAYNINKLQGKMPCYIFNIVIEGWIDILYNGKMLHFDPCDLYIYTPGFAVTVLGTSENYRAVCVIADENVVFDTPIMRNMIRAAYFPIIEMQEPKFSLTAENVTRLCRHMQNIMQYQDTNHRFKSDMLRLIYATFLLDLIDIQDTTVSERHISERVEELFIGFVRLLPKHFIEHHDIGFYADKLNITTIYLSRIVKQITGRTVVDYINHLLMMEASWLLQNSGMSIMQIADYLHFADHASFSRFFTRLRGISPKAFRLRR